jgi:2-deoxy-scyllo-inosamine dehydrogenase (SAM-dependent)
MQCSTEVTIKSWFKVVEIEVNSRCNRKCDYCPNSLLPPPNVPEYMSDEIFEKILNELSLLNFIGRISYHFYNEPLLRNDLERLVKWVQIMLPRIHQVLYTNGSLLSDERYFTLKEAGIDHFLVTKHDSMPIPQREQQTVLFPKDIEKTNRGGNLFKLKKPLSLPCYAPSEMIIITITGDILLCYEDYRRNHIMGNITTQSLGDIWFSDEFTRIRNLLINGNRDKASTICRYCDNKIFTLPNVMGEHERSRSYQT